MNKSHHPQNRFERLVNAEKKAQARARKQSRDSAVRAAREALQVKELEDAVSSREDC